MTTLPLSSPLFQPFSSSSNSIQLYPISNSNVSGPTFAFTPCRINTRRRRTRAPTTAASSKNKDVNVDVDADSSPKFVTFLGKGGSGKTTTALFAAQHYAREGLRTCFMTHSQDPTADHLLNCSIGPVPVECSHNFSAVRLETTEMLLGPLNRLKQADARLNMTQGALQGIVGEELGVLPGMDSIFSVLALEGKGNERGKFDVIVYDGVSPEETLRLMGAARAARLYLRYLRSLAEKTDLGRLAGPSLLGLVDEAMSLSRVKPSFNGKPSSEIWGSLESYLERRASDLASPEKFGCYIVIDPSRPISLSTALRYWGCAIQAGAQVSGAFGRTSDSGGGSMQSVKQVFSPLPVASMPNLSLDLPLDWDAVMQSSVSEDARKLLHFRENETGSVVRPVKFDLSKKSITLFMPGFNKSEIKLYQYRGGSELLVEAGDQRRVIQLPREVQGKLGGAKFVDRSLVITMR